MKKTPGTEERVTIIPLTERGYEHALALGALGAEVRVCCPADVMGGHLGGLAREAFTSSEALVFVGETDIVVRAIAPLLQGRDKDPAVVVVDEKAEFVLSLICGRSGKANSLIEEIARRLKATPVVSKLEADDNPPCIEDVALRFDLAIENKSSITALNSAIVVGGPLLVFDKNQERLADIKGFLSERVEGLFALGRGSTDGGNAGTCAIVSSRLEVSVPKSLSARTLILRPREFVAGLACLSGVSADEIGEAVDSLFREHGVSPLCLRNLAAIDTGGGEKGLLEFAESRGLGLELFTADELNARVAGVSAFGMSARGERGVSGPAALISSGAESLWVKKHRRATVTVSVARLPYLLTEERGAGRENQLGY